MKHPNATVGGGAPAAAATILYLLSLFGIDLPDPPLEVGILIGGVLAAVFLFIGRKGLRGIGRLLWQGDS